MTKIAPMSLTPFAYQDAPVRVVVLAGEPWFVLADVCRILEIANPSNVAARLDDDEKTTLRLVEGGPGNVLVSEPGLYSVILRSDKPQAKPFRKWVTAEVLPSIRKTGRYEVAPDASDPLVLAQRLIQTTEQFVAAETERRALAASAALNAPKVESFEAYIGTNGLHDWNSAAKAIGWGRNKMLDELRRREVLMRGHNTKNVPYQKFIDAGYFEVKVRSAKTFGFEKVTTTTYVTPKGLEYLHRLLNKRFAA